jgi:hypothetical protein
MPHLHLSAKGQSHDGRTAPFSIFCLLAGVLFSAILVVPTVSTGATSDLELTLEVAPHVTESEGVYGFVRVAAPPSTSLTVALSSSAPSVLGAPAEVTIFAGNDGSYFYLSPVNNNQPNSSPSVTITASAPGYSTATAQLIVRDDDPYAATWTTITSPQKAGVGFDTEVLFQTIEGYPAGDLRSPVTVSVANENGSADFTEEHAFLNPSLASRTSTMAITSTGQQTRLVVSFADNRTAQSAPFTVAVDGGVATEFRWDATGSPHDAGEAFPVVLRATDKFGNPVSDFSGSAQLAAFRNTATITLNGPDPWPEIKLGYPYSCAWRTTTIVQAGELGGARSIRSLALEVRALPPTPLQAFMIRIKHSNRTDFDDYTAWENDGWTTIYSGTWTVSETGWQVFRFDTPFAYDGTSSLLVDLSLLNPSPASTTAIGELGGHYTTHASTLITVNPATASGDPRQWTMLALRDFARPNLRFTAGEAATVSPTTTTAFVNGVWSGTVRIAEAGAATTLTATSDTMRGESAPFAVFGTLPATSLEPEPECSGGLTNTLSWGRTIGAGCYQLQRDTDTAFSDAVDAPLTTGTSLTFTGLLDGTKYYYRVRSVIVAGEGRTCTGPWSETISSTQDASPPVITIGTSAIATNATYTLSGTATDISGISQVTVNGTDAVTTDAFAHWARPVTLQPGVNTFTISACDSAVPAHTTTATAKILHIPSTGDINGDPDQDGLSDLMEYALGLDPATADSAGATYAMISTDGTTQQQFLAFAYRHRYGNEGLSYHVEASSDLVTWTEVMVPEVLYTYSTTDGMAYMVVVRISFSDLTDPSPRLFARLKVTVP